MKNLMIAATVMSIMSMASIVKSESLQVKFKNETGNNFILEREGKAGLVGLKSGEERSVSIPFNDMKLTALALYHQNSTIMIIDVNAEGERTLWGLLDFTRLLRALPAEQPRAKLVQIELYVNQQSQPIEVWGDTTALGAGESDDYNVTVVLKGPRGQESTLDVAAVMS